MRPARLVTIAVAVAGLIAAAPAGAHEFWIDTGAVAADGVADLRVGQELSGDALPYLDRTIRAMTHVTADAAHPIAARLGDLPAIAGLDLTADGLHILTVETEPAYIVFDTLPEFIDYLAYEGLSQIAADHLSRGLPETEIAEEYIRNARALVQTGPVRAGDTDRPTGLPFELVVRGTPFGGDQTGVEVLLTWNGVPAPDTQVAMFFVPEGGIAPGETRRMLLRTDDDGVAAFALAGPGRYLLNAVRMTPVEGPGSVVWQSYWASLSFDLPPR